MKRIIKKILLRPYTLLLKLYDSLTADTFECSIGDIILKRGDVIKENQLLLTSRLCDVEAYCVHNNESFPYQNTISRKAYGKNHNEEGGNRSFMALIESYKSKGYNPSSLITVDSDMTLMDGNHRMGLHLYEKIEKVNVRRVHRRPPFQYGVDSYYSMGLGTLFLEELHDKYQQIQQWLVNSGNTFCLVLQGCKSDGYDISKDICRLCNILSINNIQGGIGAI